MQGGVTDIPTAKSIGRKLYSSYTSSSLLQRQAMQRMLIDTYRMMNKQFRPTGQDLNLYGSLLDFNGDGVITVQDFEALAIKYLAKNEMRTYTKNVKERLNVAKRLFEQFDTDHSGYLVEKEIPALLKETYNMMGVAYTPTQEDVRSWMQMADKNGRGKVSLEDYEQLIITSLESCGIKIYDRD